MFDDQPSNLVTGELLIAKKTNLFIVKSGSYEFIGRKWFR